LRRTPAGGKKPARIEVDPNLLATMLPLNHSWFQNLVVVYNQLHESGRLVGDVLKQLVTSFPNNKHLFLLNALVQVRSSSSWDRMYQGSKSVKCMN